MTTNAEDGLNPRRQELLRLVGEQGFTTIEALAQHFGVSSQTARRDVAYLDAIGLVKRFHGGAGPAQGAQRLPYAEKQGVATDAKSRIGQAVARLLPLKSSLFLDVGTTVEAVARALLGRTDLFVATASVKVAEILALQGNGDVVVTGGLLRGPDGSLVGDGAITAIRRFSLDYAVIGCSGFDGDGSPTDFDVLKVEVKRAMMARAQRCVLVADGTKFDRAAPARIESPDRFCMLVTERRPAKPLLQRLDDGGCEVRLAGEEGEASGDGLAVAPQA